MIEAAFNDRDLVWVLASSCRALRLKSGLSLDEVANGDEPISRNTVIHLQQDEWCRTKQFEYGKVEAFAAQCHGSPSEIIDWDRTQIPSLPILPSHSGGLSRRELANKLSAATRESSPLKLRQLLTEVAKDAERILKEEDCEPGVARVRADALTRLAEIESSYMQRLEYRKGAIKTLDKSYKKSNNWLDLQALANRTVDYFYDGFNSEGTTWILPRLSDAAEQIRKTVASPINGAEDDEKHVQVLLLVQRSSLLRCLAQCEKQQNRRKRVDEAVRCAEKACQIDEDNPIGRLELGQAKWSQARQQTQPQHDESRDLAEKSLQIAVAKGLSLGHLVQARFYRETYRRREAIASFRNYLDSQPNRRRALVEAHILGEATWQLWYQDPENTLGDVEYARDLLSEAVEAGYGEARKVVALAFLQAILDGYESGAAVLKKLAPRADLQWHEMTQAAEEHARKGDVDSLRKAFVFGVDQHGIWNSLATFAAHFSQDHELALRLNEIGLDLQPRNQVLWLNQARILKELGRHSDALSAIRNARQFATPVFRPFIDEVAASINDPSL